MPLATLSATEVALPGLMKVLPGVWWTWRFAAETPPSATPAGGVMVLAALFGIELPGAARRPGAVGEN